MAIKLIPLSRYAAERGKSRAWVYLRQSKLQTVDLPLFAEYAGERIEVSTQKFVIINTEDDERTI